MYELGQVFPETTVEPGTNLLVSGPPMTGKQEYAVGILADGVRASEGAIVVTTKDDASQVREDFTELTGQDDPPVGVVDCVTRQQGSPTLQDHDLVRYASSPVDLTGIGIELSELLRGFYEERGVTENRVLLHSLSTLLMYSNLQTVFRFLHVFTGRVQSADALGLFVIDDTGHDQQTMSTLKQLFDGAIEVREEGSTRQARLVGVEGGSDWRDMQI
jgi:KaiC/GvpD/RAD55 family RecA-like ATPase